MLLPSCRLVDPVPAISVRSLSPFWGEGWGEGVTDLSRDLNPSPHPSPYGRGSRSSLPLNSNQAPRFHDRSRRCFHPAFDLRVASRQLPDALDQFPRPERLLDQNRLHTGIQPPPVLGVEVARGDDDDRNVAPARLLLQRGHHREAVHFRHHEIEQDHVGLIRLHVRERLPPVPALPHRPFPPIEPAAQPPSPTP